MKQRSLEWLWQWAPLLVAGATALLTAAITLLRYLTFHAPAYDLGFFNQVAEQTAQGHLFATSYVPYSFLGEHWEPMLGLVAQLDRVVASPIWLLLVQAVALGAAPLAAARLARTWLPQTPYAPLVAAVAMACSPLLTNGAAFDYHTEALTPAIALLALEAAARGRRLRFALLLLLLATIKEDALLVAAGAGWIAWRVDSRREGLLAAAAGVAGFLTVVLVVMPHFRDGSPGDLVSNYAWLAGGATSLPAVLAGALTHPLLVTEHLVSAEALEGWAAALLPLALLPVLSGWALLGVLPALLLALLSGSGPQTMLHDQYGLEAAPLLLACALLGWRRLPEMRQALQRGGWALACASMAGYIVAAPLPGGLRFDATTVQGLDRRAAVERVLSLIPADTPVSAQTGLVVHLGGRTAIWEFPGGFGARYIVLDADGPISAASRSGYARAFDSIPADGYRVVASAAGVTLWERRE